MLTLLMIGLRISTASEFDSESTPSVCSEPLGADFCTSPDTSGGYDCWAGSSGEKCTCVSGTAELTGQKTHWQVRAFPPSPGRPLSACPPPAPLPTAPSTPAAGRNLLRVRVLQGRQFGRGVRRLRRRRRHRRHHPRWAVHYRALSRRRLRYHRLLLRLFRMPLESVAHAVAPGAAVWGLDAADGGRSADGSGTAGHRSAVRRAAGTGDRSAVSSRSGLRLPAGRKLRRRLRSGNRDSLPPGDSVSPARRPAAYAYGGGAGDGRRPAAYGDGAGGGHADALVREPTSGFSTQCQPRLKEAPTAVPLRCCFEVWALGFHAVGSRVEKTDMSAQAAAPAAGGRPAGAGAGFIYRFYILCGSPVGAASCVCVVSRCALFVCFGRVSV